MSADGGAWGEWPEPREGVDMDPLVLAAGTAMVGAIATDTWEQVRDAVVGLWRRFHPAGADRAAAELDELRERVLRVRCNGDSAAEKALEEAWQARLAELLRADPAASEALRGVLDRVLAPALPAAGQARVGTILMTGVSRDSSTFTQIGSQVNYGRP